MMRGATPHFSKLKGLTMVNPFVNFLSYNSTGINDMKAKWIRDLYQTTDASFIGIQEHFKTVNIDKSFPQWFPEHRCYVKPGHRETGQDNGRAKGGLAQLAKKTHDIKIKNVRCDNYRLQA